MGAHAGPYSEPVKTNSWGQRFTRWLRELFGWGERGELLEVREKLRSTEEELASARKERDKALAEVGIAQAEYRKFAAEQAESQKRTADGIRALLEAVDTESIQVGREYLKYLRRGRQWLVRDFGEQLQKGSPAVFYVATAVIDGDSKRVEPMTEATLAFWEGLLEPFQGKPPPRHPMDGGLP